MNGNMQNRNSDEKGAITKHLEDTIGVPSEDLYRDVAELKPRLHGKMLTFTLAFVAGTGFTLFG